MPWLTSNGGTANAFKSLYSDKETDRHTGTVTSYIKITKIENDYGDSAAFDPDKMSNVADIFLAFGIPAPIMNTVLSDSKAEAVAAIFARAYWRFSSVWNGTATIFWLR